MTQPATASWSGCDGPGGGRAVPQEGQVINQNIPTWASWKVTLNLRSLFH